MSKLKAASAASSPSSSPHCPFQRHTDEALIGNAGAPGVLAHRFQERRGQTEIDGLVLGLHLEAHELGAGEIVFRQVGAIDEFLRLTVVFENRIQKNKW